jgi:hypothetical protein
LAKKLEKIEEEIKKIPATEKVMIGCIHCGKSTPSLMLEKKRISEALKQTILE